MVAKMVNMLWNDCYHTLLLSPGAPLTYFNDGGGVRVIFLGREKKEGFSGVAKKGLRDFWGYAKKVVIFFG